MNIDKTESLEQIVDAACGPSGDADLAKAEPMYSQFRTAHKALHIPSYDAPSEAVSEAKRLMPDPERRSIFGRLVFTTMQPLAVRSAQRNSFQMVFEGDESRVRLMYLPQGSGWEVLGQADGEGWSAERAGSQIDSGPDGHFSFSAKSLSDTGLTLVKNDVALHIPSAEEAESGGSG